MMAMALSASIVALVGLGLHWLVLAAGNARELARRAKCVCHLKWIAVALHNYHFQHGSLPVGTVPNPRLPTERRLSWLVELWDAQSIGATVSVDRSKGWDEPPNWPPKVVASEGMRFIDMEPEDMSDWVTCPDDPRYRTSKPFSLTYVGVAGVGADAPELPREAPARRDLRL
jgi:hypothetical protein